jgi:hypothetical protein
MQPHYVTLSSSGSSPWQITNWHSTPQEISFAVLSTGGSSWAISVTYEDPTRVFPNPNSTSPTAFTVLAGSSNQVINLPSSMKPIAAWMATVNSTLGNTITFVSMQSGIG